MLSVFPTLTLPMIFAPSLRAVVRETSSTAATEFLWLTGLGSDITCTADTDLFESGINKEFSTPQATPIEITPDEISEEMDITESIPDQHHDLISVIDVHSERNGNKEYSEFDSNW